MWNVLSLTVPTTSNFRLRRATMVRKLKAIKILLRRFMKWWSPCSTCSTTTKNPEDRPSPSGKGIIAPHSTREKCNLLTSAGNYNKWHAREKFMNSWEQGNYVMLAWERTCYCCKLSFSDMILAESVISSAKNRNHEVLIFYFNIINCIKK